MDVVKVVVDRGILTATLADLENRNALGRELISGLAAAIDKANADPEIRAVVITNEGSTFCAGMNLKDRLAEDEKASDSGGFTELLAAIQASPTPVIGRIAGHAVGGGIGLAAVCDVSIALEDAKFGFTEVRLGVIPAIISVVCLPKMRAGEAMEAFVRGNRFPATKAAELGLISRAVPADELDAAVEDVVFDLRKGGPNAIGLAKTLIYEIPKRDQAKAFEWATAVSNELFASDEGKEGMQAFLTKRPASWAVTGEG